ncbi:hypothetical protein CIB48_g8380 [Xylaria polymorpha]|nr:hypothetical protein CIB48_g8380 [Xylaria polymorpha]
MARCFSTAMEEEASVHEMREEGGLDQHRAYVQVFGRTRYALSPREMTLDEIASGPEGFYSMTPQIHLINAGTLSWCSQRAALLLWVRQHVPVVYVKLYYFLYGRELGERAGRPGYALTGKTVTIQVESSDNIDDAKTKIYNIEWYSRRPTTNLSRQADRGWTRLLRLQYYSIRHIRENGP